LEYDLARLRNPALRLPPRLRATNQFGESCWRHLSRCWQRNCLSRICWPGNAAVSRSERPKYGGSHMNLGDPQLLQRLAWEGLIDERTALVIALVLAVWTGWSLWRERFAVGRRWAITFWVLRMVAIGCALWMLAGPTRLRT